MIPAKEKVVSILEPQTDIRKDNIIAAGLRVRDGDAIGEQIAELFMGQPLLDDDVGAERLGTGFRRSPPSLALVPAHEPASTVELLLKAPFDEQFRPFGLPNGFP